MCIQQNGKSCTFRVFGIIDFSAKTFVLKKLAEDNICLLRKFIEWIIFTERNERFGNHCKKKVEKIKVHVKDIS